MANKNPIAQWLYNNLDQYSVSFTMAAWPKKYGFSLYDFEACCDFKGIKLLARGVDQAKDIALEKACSELLEKMICLSVDTNSEGMAASAIVDVKNHARNEALERYYLKSHLEQKIGLNEVVCSESDFTLKIQRQFNCSVQFFRMNTPSDKFGLVCKISSQVQSTAFSYGFSLGESLEIAMNKSLIEALPNFIWKLENPEANTENVWQISNDFNNRISPLLNQPDNMVEVQPPLLTEVLINKNDLFCKDIDGLVVCKFNVSDKD